MKIERIELHHVANTLVHPFRTSFGTQQARHSVLAMVCGEGLIGWGECTASLVPGYSYETNATAWHIMHDFLAPALIGQTITGPADVGELFQSIRGHEMAKATLENAAWDLFAKAQNLPLFRLLGGRRSRVKVGVSIGIQPTLTDLLKRVESFVELGYQRIKMKIEPGWELEPLTAVREQHPDIKLMADANSAFTLQATPIFQQMDELELLMIEQPLHYADIFDHAKLQAQINTPICLDESIHAPRDARQAIAMQACQIINIKVGRVGGLSNALKIHHLCQEADIPLWCGGMLETGIGRATNLHMASLPNFTLPGDISATDRYYAEDIAEPRFTLNREDSTITVPTQPGLGIKVLMDRIEKRRQQHAIFKA